VSSKHAEFASPLGAAEHARLEFARGASRVTIHVDGAMQHLFRARFDGAAPMVLADAGRVTIEYPRLSPSEWLRPGQRSAEVVLNRSVPWKLVFGGGVSRLRADLAALALRSLEIRRGASDVDIALPEPRGVVHVRVGGGATKLALRRPGGTAAILSIARGATNLAFDAEHFGSIGGEMRLASQGAAEVLDRYEIDIGGGASDIVIAAT
jgi:hypothetical protein